jgi:HSP20 family molecular chaperone IbpA
VTRGATEATYENGVVEVRVPKTAEVEPRRIEIKPRAQVCAIDASAG